MLAWGAVEFLRFGPMAEIGRPERFDFWPDPRGFTSGSSVWFSKRDATHLIPRRSKRRAPPCRASRRSSDALRDARPITGDAEDARYRCKLTLTMANDNAALALEVLTEWKVTRVGAAMVEPGAQ